jgi:2-polyprenyl-3-methyl-5-hydroxy-6-metoxy-1,4-benzoquinol methylase
MLDKDDNKIISHSTISQSFEKILIDIKKRLLDNKFSSEDTLVNIQLLDKLSNFELGRFLLTNKGLNGYWTDYILTYPKKAKTFNIYNFEKVFLEKLPTLCATQQRFDIFLNLNQQQVKNNAKLASIPSGLGGELFYLDLSSNLNLDLYLIDLDNTSLESAKLVANERGLKQNIHYIQENAWKINFKNKFDLISSNGLTLYEADDNKVIELFQKFYEALNSGGLLVTSTLTPPRTLDKNSEWDMTKIDADMLQLQKKLFSDIIQATWQCYRSSYKIAEMLRLVGFVDITATYDSARIFPTISARKS